MIKLKYFVGIIKEMGDGEMILDGHRIQVSETRMFTEIASVGLEIHPDVFSESHPGHAGFVMDQAEKKMADNIDDDPSLKKFWKVIRQKKEEI